MIGVVALMVAGLGTFASAGASPVEGNLVSLGDEAVGAPQAPGAQARAVDDVDVSRSFDRPTLERQTAAQSAQRTRALQEIDLDVTATAERREREEAAREQEEQEREREEEQERREQWVLPVAGYTLSARFGQQNSRWSSGSHTGLDFAGPSGTEIVSVAAGTVTSAGYEGAYGNRTVVTLADGTEISYSHQSRLVAKVGDEVQPGETIGYTGSTGNVTGPHLHLEVEPPGAGKVDPERVLREHGVSP